MGYANLDVCVELEGIAVVIEGSALAVEGKRFDEGLALEDAPDQARGELEPRPRGDIVEEVRAGRGDDR